MRVHYAYSSASWARSLPDGISDAGVSRTAGFSGFAGRFIRGIVAARVAGGDEFSGLAGSRAAWRVGEHDAFGAEHEHVRQRRGENARGSVAADVSASADRSDHEWRACGDLDRAVVSGDPGSLHSNLARGQLQFAQCVGIAAGRGVVIAPAGQARTL